VVQAAPAGRHIFCEKPLALSVADCARMIAAARTAGVHLCVGHGPRDRPVFDRMKAMIGEGVIGEPFARRVSRLGGWGAQAAWRQRRATCGGPRFEVNAHELDDLPVLGEPETVYATGAQIVLHSTDFAEAAFVSVRLRGGRHGLLHSSVAAGLGSCTGLLPGAEGPSVSRPGRAASTGCASTAPAARSAKWWPPTPPSATSPTWARPARTAARRLHGEDGRAMVAIAEAAVASMASGEAIRVAGA